jgi:hypothetical protein
MPKPFGMLANKKSELKKGELKKEEG